MMEAPNLYPKVTVDLSTPIEELADRVFHQSMRNGVLKGIFQVNNTDKPFVCMDGLDIADCPASTEALNETLLRLPFDENEGFTGWLGYTPADITCSACLKVCSVKLRMINGDPTEEVRYTYVKPLDPDTP